jgi:hypothetical protein
LCEAGERCAITYVACRLCDLQPAGTPYHLSMGTERQPHGRMDQPAQPCHGCCRRSASWPGDESLDETRHRHARGLSAQGGGFQVPCWLHRQRSPLPRLPPAATNRRQPTPPPHTAGHLRPPIVLGISGLSFLMICFRVVLYFAYWAQTTESGPCFQHRTWYTDQNFCFVARNIGCTSLHP